MSNNFKHTDIGLIPVDWELKKLREVSDVKAGGNAPQGEKYFQDGKNLFIRVQHFDGDKEYVDRYDLITDEAVEEYNLKIFPQDSILFPKSGASIHLEKRAKLPFKSYIVSHLAVLNSYDIINNDFLFYLTKKMKFAKSADGSTLPYLNINQLKEEYIPFPPLPEQKKIAYVLSKIQQAIETQEQIIKTTQELKKALMQKLFTEGLPASGGTEPEPQKQTEIGPIPESWEVVMISSLGDIVTGTTPRTAIERYYIPQDIDFIAPADIGKTKYIYDSEKKISNEGLAVIRPLPKGSVLCVCIGSSIGKVGLSYKNISTTNQQVNSIVCNQNYDSEFIYYLFSYYADYWRRFASPNPVPILSKGKFGQIEMPVSKNLNSQTKIAQILSSIDGKIEFSANSKNILMDLFQSTLNQLMTGQIRVNDIEFEIEKTQLSLLEKGRRDVLEW